MDGRIYRGAYFTSERRSRRREILTSIGQTVAIIAGTIALGLVVALCSGCATKAPACDRWDCGEDVRR